MKKIKRLFIIILLFISFYCLSVYASGEYISDVVVSLQIDNPFMKINGNDFEIDPGRGTSPIVVRDRTLVPIRAIIESFGGEVEWIHDTETVVLTMNNDVLKLVINSNTAYLNDIPYVLDVVPSVINDRTMLPVRFISESFNLAVAWDEKTKTVYIIRNSFDESEYDYIKSVVPEFEGRPYVEINGNKPLFKDYEVIDASFEFYGNLDEYERCDVCFASVSEDIMPTEPRGDISAIKPTGWKNKSYDFIDGKYIYNRCHLIGFQLTGENDNKRNLITGTRYLNIEAMLPFENMVDDYIEETDNNVMYRVTPVFTNGNMVADGVLMEAYSVEDKGAGISFCVYCYNVQPGVNIDYLTGDNSQDFSMLNELNNKIDMPEWKSDDAADNTLSVTTDVYNGNVYKTPTGKKYHFDIACGGKNSFATTYDDAVKSGLTPCSKCVN